MNKCPQYFPILSALALLALGAVRFSLYAEEGPSPERSYWEIRIGAENSEVSPSPKSQKNFELEGHKRVAFPFLQIPSLAQMARLAENYTQARTEEDEHREFSPRKFVLRMEDGKFFSNEGVAEKRQAACLGISSVEYLKIALNLCPEIILDDPESVAGMLVHGKTLISEPFERHPSGSRVTLNSDSAGLQLTVVIPEAALYDYQVYVMRSDDGAEQKLDGLSKKELMQKKIAAELRALAQDLARWGSWRKKLDVAARSKLIKYVGEGEEKQYVDDKESEIVRMAAKVERGELLSDREIAEVQREVGRLDGMFAGTGYLRGFHNYVAQIRAFGEEEKMEAVRKKWADLRLGCAMLKTRPCDAAVAFAKTLDGKVDKPEPVSWKIILTHDDNAGTTVRIIGADGQTKGEAGAVKVGASKP